mgnify:CR=1 FL=1
MRRYNVDATDVQILLGYSDLFPGTVPELIPEIQKLNMHKAISIISELIALRNSKMKPVNVYGYSLQLPYETVLKKKILGIGDTSCKDLSTNPIFRRNQHVVSIQMLLILLKKIIAYGNYETLNQVDYKIDDADYAKIIQLQLIVVDEVCQKEEHDFDKGYFVFSSYHLNHRQSNAGRFLRMYYMLEVLNQDADNFPEDIRGEYRNYYDAFSAKYEITTTQYASILFWELRPYYLEENFITHMSAWRTVDDTYKKSESREIFSKALGLLSAKPEALRDWAIESQNRQWDFSKFLEVPFLRDNEGRYISISDYTLSNAFFEKLFWLIRECYPKSINESMAFYGRLFEKYVQELAHNMRNSDYTFMNEFLIETGMGNVKSSDAYLQKGNRLLAIEAKGFSNLSSVMAKNSAVDKNNSKLFVCPILEADAFCTKALQNGRFADVAEMYIVSVTMDNIEANPFYYEKIFKEIESKKTCTKVVGYFNFSIADYEMLMCAAEDGADVFELLKEYFSLKELPPFGNYLTEKMPKLSTMTDFMKHWYNEACSKMMSMLK